MRLKYINLNLWWGGRLMKNIIEFFDKEKPDIIACQEALNSTDSNLPDNFQTIKVLRKNLNNFFFSFSPAFFYFYQQRKIECGNLIGSKFPILNTKTIFYDIPYRQRKYGAVFSSFTEDQKKDFIHTPRNLQMVEIKINSQMINVFNTQGIWDAHGRDNHRRLRMSQIIADQIKGKKNLILSGDFNVNEGTQSIKNLEDNLHSVFKGELKTTFNMRHKTDPGYGKAVVDMIFVSQEFKIIDHYCPSVDVSDHLPLVCILEI